MSLKDGQRFDDMARRTRKRYESNRPRAVLFEGPPGTGKTLTARILARRCGRPMVQVKTEKIVSKWYGEATKNLSKVFDACEALEALGEVVGFLRPLVTGAGEEVSDDARAVARQSSDAGEAPIVRPPPA